MRPGQLLAIQVGARAHWLGEAEALPLWHGQINDENVSLQPRTQASFKY